MATAGFDWRRVAATACLHVDWTQIAFAALGSADLAGLVHDSLRRLGRRLEAEALADPGQPPTADEAASQEPPPPNEPPSTRSGSETPPAAEAQATKDSAEQTFVDPKAQRAAALLGVDVGATEDEVRAALRSRLSSSRLHPDHGGDGEEATSLIAAKNLLVERLRAMRP